MILQMRASRTVLARCALAKCQCLEMHAHIYDMQKCDRECLAQGTNVIDVTNGTGALTFSEGDNWGLQMGVIMVCTALSCMIILERLIKEKFFKLG
jgi:hypothetical protein